MRATSAPTSKPLSFRSCATLGSRRPSSSTKLIMSASPYPLRRITNERGKALITRFTNDPQPRSSRVVEVDDELAADVDQEHGVLSFVGDAEDADPVGDAHPGGVGEHLDPVSVTGEVAGDAAAHVVREQDPRLTEERERCGVEVVGMTV